MSMRIPEIVGSIPEGQFLASTDEQLFDHIQPQVSCDPLILHEDQMEMEPPREAMVKISDYPHPDMTLTHAKGIRVNVTIPYSGPVGLWQMAPTRFIGQGPEAYIERQSDDTGILHIIKEQPNHVPIEQLKPQIEHELALIRGAIAVQAETLKRHKEAIRGQIFATVQDRRKRISLHQTVPNLLGIPLKRKAEAPNFEPIEIRRKLVRPLPATSQKGVAPEPGIPEAEYQHILKVIRHAGRTFEATAPSYHALDEEALRDIMLANLNGHYEGLATGEAFRKSGKTDIKIEWGDRSAFVSENKIWRGPKEMSDAIAQLLSYLTWRDGRAALLIFNKDVAGFTEIAAKIPDVLKAHPSFKQNLGSTEKGEWKVRLSCPDDVDRSITVTVYAFNLYVSPGK